MQEKQEHRAGNKNMFIIQLIKKSRKKQEF
jgi:hypothetical protein